jgi:hypothetical protein
MRLKHGVFGTKEAILMGKMDIHQWIVDCGGSLVSNKSKWLAPGCSAVLGRRDTAIHTA